MNPPNPSRDVCDRTLYFWEKGPLRQLVETEFESALLDVYGQREIPFNREKVKILHDTVIPSVFLSLVQEFPGLAEENNLRYAVQQESEIRYRIVQTMNRHLDVHEQYELLPPQKALLGGRLLLAFRTLPKIFKTFFSP